MRMTRSNRAARRRARHRRAGTDLDVDHRAHGRARPGKTAAETGHAIAHALADQLAVGIVVFAGQAVRDHGRQQGVDRAEQPEDHPFEKNQGQFLGRKDGQLEAG